MTNKLTLIPEYELYERSGTAFCDSLQIAETFGKQHKHILRDIEKFTEPKSGLSESFVNNNFSLSYYKDTSGKKNPKYYLTKDGFTMLTFGYTGVKAMRFKEVYIKRFNEMEGFIKSLQAIKMEFPAFTEAVMMSHEEPKSYHYANEINMIYRIVLGTDAKGYRLSHNLSPDEPIKPHLTAAELKAVETLQRVDIGLLEVEGDYHKRQGILAVRYRKTRPAMYAGTAASL